MNTFELLSRLRWIEGRREHAGKRGVTGRRSLNKSIDARLVEERERRIRGDTADLEREGVTVSTPCQRIIHGSLGANMTFASSHLPLNHGEPRLRGSFRHAVRGPAVDGAAEESQPKIHKTLLFHRRVCTRLESCRQGGMRRRHARGLADPIARRAAPIELADLGSHRTRCSRALSLTLSWRTWMPSAGRPYASTSSRTIARLSSSAPRRTTAPICRSVPTRSPPRPLRRKHPCAPMCLSSRRSPGAIRR